MPQVQTPPLDNNELKKALESVLFITDHALSLADLCKITGVKDAPRIQGLVEELRAALETAGSPVQLIEIAEGYQMATRPSYAPFVRKLFAERMTMRLSTAAHETLSIVAYKQPITRAEIEEVRGVEVIAALETLLEKRLLKVVGRKESVGRPLLYGTTPEFLRHFGLKSIEDLPPLEKFAEAAAEAERAALAAAQNPENGAAAPAPEASLETPVETPAETPAEAPVEPAVEAEPAPAEEQPKNIWSNEEKPNEDPSSGQ
jgi:segregation and condensation protein B